MGTHHPIRKTVTAEIPDKLYFRIGDVARLCEVPAYVLRFWETEFPQLRPNKGGTGQRLYRKRDVEMALRIKSLLYDQGYTIPGARQVFKTEQREREAAAVGPVTEAAIAGPSAAPELGVADAAVPGIDVRPDPRHTCQLAGLRKELQAIHALLCRPVDTSGGPRLPAVHNGVSSSSLDRAEKLQPLRPRLVLEPRPAAARLPELPRHRLQQRDLFSSDGPDSAG